MIPIHRGPEPDLLRQTRNKALPALQRLVKQRSLTSKDIDGYRCVADDLWRTQHRKCCYCEVQLLRSFNDVEHYRPKTSADRRPGCTTTHGYWWLAFHWSNLLFACPSCNRSGKNDLFPLEQGSVALTPPERPPGGERPLLLDPAVDNGVEHIAFGFIRLSPGDRCHWIPRPRRGSQRGAHSIHVLRLDANDLVELYDSHVNSIVRPVSDDLNRALAKRDPAQIDDAFQRALRLLHPTLPFVGLSYDALCILVPAARLLPAGLFWPEPGAVGRARRRRPT